MIWHSSGVEETLKIFESDKEKGLSNGVADEKLQAYGVNSFSVKEKKGFFYHIFNQINNFPVISLLAVAVLSIIITWLTHDGSWFNPILIFTTVALYAVIGAYQEIKTDDASYMLKDISAPKATVIREGMTRVIDASQLVPGDIILLKAGDYISADARLISSLALCCNESVLTGNHAPADKNADVTLEDITPLNERTNMVFAGCSVMHGTGCAVVVATGIDTELGKEQSLLLQSGENQMPIRAGVMEFVKIFSTVVLVVCALLFVISLIYNFRNPNISRTLIDTFLSSMALAVAVIPEGIPAVIAVILTLGVQRLLKKNVIVKDISSVEKMGKVSVILADKTGTLTENNMTVTRVFNGHNIVDNLDNSGDDIKMILELATICNNASENSGDPTGKGIAEACLKLTGMSKSDIENLYPRLGEVPFDSTRKLMTTINMINGKPFAIVKGAPESLLPLCVGKGKEQFLKVIDDMAEDALRVIAVAAKPIGEIPANPNSDELECNLNFIGFIGLEDNPRFEAVRAVADCKKAGIRTVMITGDHPLTAKSIARRLGILTDDTDMLTGSELKEMSDDDLTANIEKYSVYARISNADRLRIVNAWQKAGHGVAVTGDGVDDVPALSVADVGCAMGKSGTDVAKGVSDIILTDDDFSSIVNYVKEGRAIYSNVRKALTYLIGSNIGEMIFMLFGVLFFKKFPLNASQLLWVNLLTDLAPLLAIGMEPPEPDIMNEKPKKRQSVFGKTMLINTAVNGFVIGILGIVSYLIGSAVSSSAASTMAFGTVVLSQLLFCISARSERASIINVFSANLQSFLLVGISLFLMIFIMLTPARILFDITLLSFNKWLVIIAFSFIPFVITEAIKIIQKLIKQ